jgi:hypothetical protein
MYSKVIDLDSEHSEHPRANNDTDFLGPNCRIEVNFFRHGEKVGAGI